MPNNSLIKYRICLNNKITSLYCYLQDKRKHLLPFCRLKCLWLSTFDKSLDKSHIKTMQDFATQIFETDNCTLKNYFLHFNTTDTNILTSFNLFFINSHVIAIKF